MAQGLDKYLGGSQIASQQPIEAVVAPMMQQLFAQRDEAINSAFQQLAAKLQQLESALGQVALAAQQQKLSPFDIAMKAITHFGDDEPEPAAQRCREKGLAIMERWLDAALETSEAGSGDAGRAETSARQEEAEASAGEPGNQPSPHGDQAQEIPAENG